MGLTGGTMHMSKISKQDVANLIEQAGLPRPKKIEAIEAQFNSHPFLVEDQWIIRVPQRAEAAKKLALESKFLKVLNQQTTAAPIALPDVTLFATKPVFARHQIIEGMTLDVHKVAEIPPAAQRAMAEKMAAFLVWEHQIPVADLADVPLEIWDRFDQMAEKKAEYLAILKQDRALPAAIKQAAIQSIEAFSRPDIETVQRYPSQADLLPKNVVVCPDNLQLVGVFDFGDSGLISVEDEFTQLALDWPAEMVKHMAQYYQAETGHQIDLKKVYDQALFFRSAMYADWAAGKMPAHVTDCPDVLKDMVARIEATFSNKPSVKQNKALGQPAL